MSYYDEKKRFMQLRDEYRSKFYGDNNTILLITEIISAYPILGESIEIDGVEYKRLSNSFINEYFKISAPSIRKSLNRLEEEGIIKMVMMDQYNLSVRYIHVDDDELSIMM